MKKIQIGNVLYNQYAGVVSMRFIIVTKVTNEYIYGIHFNSMNGKFQDCSFYTKNYREGSLRLIGNLESLFWEKIQNFIDDDEKYRQYNI